MDNDTNSPNNEDVHKQLLDQENLLNDLENNLSTPQSNLDNKIRDQLYEKILNIKNINLNAQNNVRQLENQNKNLLALAEVGGKINSSLDTNDVLQLVIDTIIKLTGGERCFLMLRNESNELEARIARNWKHESLSEKEEAISTTVINRVVEFGEPVLTTNAQEDPRFQTQASIVSFNLRSIICVPLKIRDEVIGVIYTDHKTQIGKFIIDDLDLLSAFSNQAAIALQNANLYEKLQQSNLELQIAYNKTLEGWAKALELRDQSTEGHTQRVTKMTVELALFMNIDEHDIVNIRRGALLHDIGKMGIPDRILHKPSGLNKKEREVMNLHPKHAYDMLSQIDFLKLSLDIPYCHHEKWDGTGYPRKLKGEHIPLSARIFTIIDVWDAMTTDRPYRKGIPKDEVLQYIKDQSGLHFDPDVVKSFVDMLDSQN